MSTDNMNSSTVYKMFEEIKTKLIAKSETNMQTVEVGNIAELQDVTERLEQVSEALNGRHEVINRHTVDFMSNKALVVLAAAVVMLFVSLWIIHSQRQTLRQYRDNDLKYRYIEMRGEVSPSDIMMLREVFDYNRDRDSIRAIRDRVEYYERLVREHAEQTARAKLNAEEADRLKNEAEQMRR